MQREVGLRLLVLCAFASVAYLPSFQVPFVFDDVPNLLLNPRVQPETIEQLILALDARGAQDRPVAMVTFALNYLAGGLDPFGYHFVNLVIHVGNTLLVFAIVALLARAPLAPSSTRAQWLTVAFLGALVWSVHPVHTQAVTYIVQRMASMAALFYLVAILAYVLWRHAQLRAPVAWGIILVSYLAAMGTKSHTATVPAALLLVELAFFSRWTRAHGAALAVVAALGAALLVALAGHTLHHLLVAPSNRDFSGLERVLTQGRVLWHYLSLLVFPAADRLQLDYDFTISRGLLEPPITALAWGGILALTACALAALRRAPWLAFGWLFFLLAISIESSFLPLELVFEHRVYLPSALFVPCVIAALWASLPTPRVAHAAAPAVLLLCGVLTWQTIERNTQWASFGGFWPADFERGASPERVTVNAANRYLRQGEPRKALNVLAAGEGEGHQALQQRGEALVALGRFDEALETFEQVARQRPFWTRTAYYTAISHLESGRPGRARTIVDRVRRLHPASVYVPALDARLLRSGGEPAAAAERLRRALESGAYHVNQRLFLRLQLAGTYLAMDDPEAARSEYRRVVETDPHQWFAWVQLHRLLESGGSDREAAVIRRYLEDRGVTPEGFR